MAKEKQKREKWWKTFTWYFYQLSMIAICITTIAIIYANKVSLKITIDEETGVLITILSLVLTFFGINTYSSFLANIAEEKEQLRELQSQYEDLMAFERRKGEHERKLLGYYQTCQMIIDSRMFNSQIFEWIIDLQHYIKECKDYLQTLYNENREFTYSSFKWDFIHVSRSIKIQLESFRNRILDEDSKFFTKVKESDKKNFLDGLNKKIIEIEALEEYDYTGETKAKSMMKEPQLSLKERLKNVWSSIKRVFVP